MGRRRYNFNRMKKLYPFKRVPNVPMYKGSPFLGNVSAHITAGSNEFGTGTSFTDMTVTLSQKCGDYGFARIQVSGSYPGSFQLVELEGRTVGPYDLDEPAIKDLMVVGWEGESTTFKVNVKTPVPQRTYTASMAIIDDRGDLVKTIDLIATPLDAFMAAVKAVSSAAPLALWSPANYPVGVIVEDQETASDLLGNESGIATAYADPVYGWNGGTAFIGNAMSGSVQTEGGDPEGVPFTSYSLSHTLDNYGQYTNILAGPLTAFEGLTLAGTWFLVFQGPRVNFLTTGQGNCFHFLGTTSPSTEDHIQFNGNNGSQNKWRYIWETSYANEMLTAPMRTMTMAITRNSTGDLVMYAQEGGQPTLGSAVVTTDAGGPNWDSTAEFWPTTTAGSPDRTVGNFTLLAAVAFDDALDTDDIEALNLAVK